MRFKAIAEESTKDATPSIVDENFKLSKVVDEQAKSASESSHTSSS